MAKRKKQVKDDELLTEIKDAYKEAKRHSAEWRTETVENYNFIAGHQWSAEDEAQLAEEGRPVVTFNRMGPYFDAISGYEINNRQEIKYLPRTTDDAKQNELLTAAVRYLRDQSNAEDEESDAFYDMLSSGMGWTETYMDYDENPDGESKTDRIDPIEMFWDSHSKKRNLSDRKWHQRIKWMTEEEIKDKWPDAEIGQSNDIWVNEEAKQPHNASLAFLYRENGSGYDEKSGRYRVIQHQYFTKEDFYRVADPETGQIVTLSSEKFDVANKMAEANGIQLNYVKQKKKVYKQAIIIGDEIVEHSDLRCGFTFLCMTGKRDRNNNTWYGLARVMKDPQRWANKFLSQVMHTVNSNAKGGLMAEEGAFVDPRKAEEQWSDPSAVVLFKNGALTGGKIKERTPSPYPQGLDRLLQYAITAIPDVTGVNMEFLGASDRQQAGILEQERKKSTFTILAGFFDSLRLYRKELGVMMMSFVKEYLNDGRIIRITTEQGEQQVPLRLTEDAMEYDIIVDQSPDSPNLKEEVWNSLQVLIPQFLKAGVRPPPDIFKYSPLPTDMAMKFAASMGQNIPPEVQQQMEQLQQQNQELQMQLQQTEQKANDKMMALQSKHALGEQKLQLQAQTEQMKADVLDQASMREFQAELVKIGNEQQTAMAKLRAEMMHDMEKMRQQMEIEVMKAALDHQTKMTAEHSKAADRAVNSKPVEQKQPEIIINNYIPKSSDKKIKLSKGKNGDYSAEVNEVQ